MAASLLTTASVLQCPHGGSVTIVSANMSASASAALALANDTFTIAGCPFQIPVGTGTVPHPCVKVQWTRPNTHTMVNGTPTLTKDSGGLCLAGDQAAQGQVSIVQVQSQVSGS